MLKQFNVIYDISQIREHFFNSFRDESPEWIETLTTAWLTITLANIHALPMSHMRIHPAVRMELNKYRSLDSMESLLYKTTPIPWDRLQIPANFNCSIALVRNDLILTFM